MTYIISYNPSQEGSTPSALIQEIHNFPHWAVINSNTFIVDAGEQRPIDVVARLDNACNGEGQFVVLTVARPGATRRADRELNAWLRAVIPADPQ